MQNKPSAVNHLACYTSCSSTLPSVAATVEVCTSPVDYRVVEGTQISTYTMEERRSAGVFRKFTQGTRTTLQYIYSRLRKHIK